MLPQLAAQLLKAKYLGQFLLCMMTALIHMELLGVCKAVKMSFIILKYRILTAMTFRCTPLNILSGDLGSSLIKFSAYYYDTNDAFFCV